MRGHRGRDLSVIGFTTLCKRCLSSPILWARIPFRARCTSLCEKVCYWLAACRWFSLGPPVSPANKTDAHDITEIYIESGVQQHQTNKHISYNEDFSSELTKSNILIHYMLKRLNKCCKDYNISKEYLNGPRCG